jgi:hypothetical protein
VSGRLLRNLLVVVGTYWLAEWLATLIVSGEAAMGIEYHGSGRLGELWIGIRMGAPRALAAGGGTALLWLTLGGRAARVWMWVLAALFAGFGLMNRQVHGASSVSVDPVSRAIDLGVYSLLPLVGCVVSLWLLERFLPTAAGSAPLPESTDVAVRGRSRALLIASGVLVFLAGSSVGMWITSTVQIQQMSGWMLAALESSRRSQYAFTQYREADYAEAKNALEQLAAYLEGLKPASREWQPGEAVLVDERGLAFDRMLTYGRLAIRAERAGRPDEATVYWQRAEGYARALNWEEPTRDRIRVTVIRVDRDQPGMSAAPSK